MAIPKANVTMPYDHKVKGLSLDNGGGGGEGITIVPVGVTVAENVYTYNFGLSFNEIKELIDNSIPVFTWSYTSTSGTYSETKGGCALAGYLIENDNGAKQGKIEFLSSTYMGFISETSMIAEADWDTVIIEQAVN